VNPVPDPVVSRRGLLVSAAASGLAFIAQLAVAFVMAPMLLHYFGRERYGTWSFVESFLAYFTLFDLGISATLVRYVPRCRATGDLALLNRIVSGSLLIFSAAGLGILVLGLALFSLLLHVTRKVPAAIYDEVWYMTVVSVAALALNMPLSVFPAILDGLGRFSLKAALRTLFLGLRVLGVMCVIRFGGNLVGLAVVFAATTVAEQLVLACAVRLLLPNLNPAPWCTDRATLRLVRGYSFDSFLAMLAGRIAFKTDAIVIGLCGELGMIPFFDMPSRLVEYAKNLIRSGTTALTPAISALEVTGGKAAIRDLFLTGCRYALYLTLPIQLALMMFGGAFLELWLGDPEYRLRGQPVLWILGGTLSVGLLQSVAARVLYGVGQIRRFARLMLLEAGLNLVLSLVLYQPLGLNGVALGTAIPNLVMCIYVLLQVCALLQVTDRRIFRESLAGPLLCAILLFALWRFLGRMIPPTTRLGFVELIGIGVASYGLVVAALEFGLVHVRRAVSGTPFRTWGAEASPPVIPE
jgi:O-antigen/teichoic acid export membrane protein